MIIESRLEALGLTLPDPVVVPPGARLPFAMIRVHCNRAFISGHAALNANGTLAGPFGKVGEDVTLEEGYHLARLVGLSMISSLKRELGDLDRVTGWLRVFGMVNSSPEFNQHPMVINGLSDLLIELWGPDQGRHARSAVGMAALPFNIAVEIEAEVEISSEG